MSELLKWHTGSLTWELVKIGGMWTEAVMETGEALLESKLWGRLSGAQLPVGMGEGPRRHGTLPSLAYGRHSSLRSPIRILSVLHAHKPTSAIIAPYPQELLPKTLMAA